MPSGVMLLFHLFLILFIQQISTNCSAYITVLDAGYALWRILPICLSLLTVFLYHFTLLLTTKYRMEDRLLFPPLPVTCTDCNPLSVFFPPRPVQRLHLHFHSTLSHPLCCLVYSSPKPVGITLSPKAHWVQGSISQAALGRPHGFFASSVCLQIPHVHNGCR